jgi:RNA polymerase sigma factor FliA
MPKNEGLWQLYKTRNDAQAREQLILAYAYLAKYVVDRMPLRPSAVVSYDDMLGHAIVGLIDAVEKFDIHREIKFETYAVTRIRGSVLDALKNLDWMPRSMRSSEHKLRDVMVSLEAELGRPANDAELALAMGVSSDDLDKLFTDMGQSAVLSLEEMLGYGEENGSEIDVPSVATDSDPVVATSLQHRTRFLAKAVGELPEKEKLIVSLYYNEGLTFKEIAKVLGVTESRICQLHSKAVLRLNGKLARHKDLLLEAA